MNKISTSLLALATVLSLNMGLALAQENPFGPPTSTAPATPTTSTVPEPTAPPPPTTSTTPEPTTPPTTSTTPEVPTTPETETSSTDDDTDTTTTPTIPSHSVPQDDQDGGSEPPFERQADNNPYFERIPVRTRAFELLPVNTRLRGADHYKQLNANACREEARRLADYPASSAVLGNIDNSQPIHVVELCPTQSFADANVELPNMGNVTGMRGIISRNGALHQALGRQGFKADDVIAITRGDGAVYIYVHKLV